MGCWTGTLRFLNVLFTCGLAWQRAVPKVQPRSANWLLSGGVYVGRRCGRKWKTVSAQPSHSHFPYTRHPTLLSQIPLFTLLQDFVCVCVLLLSQCLPCWAVRFLPFSRGQTFPVCKHWRTRDTAVSWLKTLTHTHTHTNILPFFCLYAVSFCFTPQFCT